MAREALYPYCGLEDAMVLAKTIFEKSSGRPMRRLTLFDAIGKSPGSSTSRMLVTASSCYGLTKGNYNAEFISLTDQGKKIIEQSDGQAIISAVLGVPTFKSFFEHYKNATLPDEAVIADFLKAEGIPEKRTGDCSKVLLATGRYAGLIVRTSGKDRVVSVEHALEKLKDKNIKKLSIASPEEQENNTEDAPVLPLQRKVKSLGIPALNINIQIELPGNAMPEQYESIFKNMRKYLIDDEGIE